MFSRVAETRSFSAAARSFDTTTSSISKRIAALEARLGVRLLARTTRRVSLTDAGAAFYAHVSKILAEVAEAEEAVARLGGSVRGTLRLTAPTVFGEHYVAALVPQLLAEHPDLRVELVLTDRLVNLAEEGFDCAVRIGTLADSSLVAVRIAEVESVVCGAPSYLAARGTPQTPQDLAVHDCIHLSLIPLAREWRFRDEGGHELSVPVTSRFVLNSGAAMAGAVVAGAGLARLPMFLVEDALARGEVVEVLHAWKTRPTPVHVVYPGSPQLAPRLRVFVDRMRRTCTHHAKRGVTARPKRRRRNARIAIAMPKKNA